MKKFTLVNILLLALAGFLSYDFFSILTRPSISMESLAAVGNESRTSNRKRSGLGSGNDKVVPAIGEYYSIVEKNLFDPDRADKKTEEDISDEEPAPLELRNYELVGCITLDNGEKAAFIKDKSKRITRRYYVGDPFEDYTVTEIQPFKVIFSKGRSKSYLDMFSESKVTGPKWSSSDRTRKSAGDAVSKKNYSTKRSSRRVTGRER